MTGKQKWKVGINQLGDLARDHSILANKSFDLESNLLDADQEAFRRIRSLSRRHDLAGDLRFMAEHKYDSEMAPSPRLELC